MNLTLLFNLIHQLAGLGILVIIAWLGILLWIDPAKGKSRITD